MHVRAGIVVFPGSNCDRDMMHVLRDVCGIDAQFFWHEKPLPKSGLDALVLPGGFSYGDRLRAGVIAAHRGESFELGKKCLPWSRLYKLHITWN